MFSNFLQSLVSRLSVAFLGFAVLIISAKYLGVSSRGEISLFLFNIALLQVITEVFTGYHLLHFLPRYPIYKLYSFGVLFSFAIAFIGNSVLVLVGKHIEGFQWQAFAVTFLVSLNTFHCVMILGQGKLQLYYGLSLLQPALLLTSLLGYLYFTKDYTFKAYIYPLLFSFAMASLFSFLKFWPGLKQDLTPQPFEPVKILKNGSAAQMAFLLFVLGNKFSFYFLESRADLGVYSVAVSFTESVLVLVSAMLPLYLSKITSQVEQEKSVSLTIRLGKLSLLICSISLLLLNVIPETVYLKILGEGFRGIKETVLLYSPAVLFTSVYLIFSNYFTGKGQAGLVMRNNLPGFVITVLITPWLVQTYGLKGAAIAATCVYGTNTLFLVFMFFRITRVPPK